MKIENPYIKHYWLDIGSSLETAIQATNDCLLFVEKKDPDSWIDSCRAMLKFQPLEFYENHFPQSVKYIEAANRAEPKGER
jgi:hypothetical protein